MPFRSGIHRIRERDVNVRSRIHRIREGNANVMPLFYLTFALFGLSKGSIKDVGNFLRKNEGSLTNSVGFTGSCPRVEL
jgi:hypothetical protein